MNEQSKSLLVVKTSGMLSTQEANELEQGLQPLCQKLNAQVMIVDSRADATLHHDLGPLCQQLGALIDAMAKQHSVFCRLAASNEALVQAMAEAEGNDPGDVTPLPARGLNGRPL